MIKITDRWSVNHDGQQWVLTENYMGKDRDGNPKPQTRLTYFPWLDQAMRYAAERDCEGATAFFGIAKAYVSLQHALRDCVVPLARSYEERCAEVRELKRELQRVSTSSKRRKKDIAA